MSQAILDFMRPATTPKIPEMRDLPSSWADARRVAIDLECCDPTLRSLGIGSRRNGYVVGYSFSIEDGPSFYVPLRHTLGGNVPDAEAAWRYLVDRAAEFRGIVVTCGGAYDHDYLLEAGGVKKLGAPVVWHRDVRYRDVALNAALIDERAGDYSLDGILARHDLPGKDETLLRAAADAYGADPKKELYKIPGNYVVEYGLGDVAQLHPLLRKQEDAIEEQELERAVETESKLLPVVVAMRRRGMPVNMDRLDQLGRWAARCRDACIERFRQEAGLKTFSLDVMRSPIKFNAVVKAITGKNLPTTDKGNYSTSREVIDVFAAAFPLFRHLQEAKNYDKTLTTQAGIAKHVTNGRLHSTFKQIVGEDDAAEDETSGAAFGRMASSHSNLQNQRSPERDPEHGGRTRSIYQEQGAGEDPEEQDFVSVDYAQQEPRRGLEHACRINGGLPGARRALAMLQANPDLDPYMPLVEMTGLPRKTVKVIYLAQAYAQTERALCENLGLPTERIQNPRTGRYYVVAGPEGKAVINQFDAGAPYLRMLAKIAENRAVEKGFIKLMDGRRCRFEREPHTGNVLNARVAMNRLLQGDSGIQTKLALIELHRRGVPLVSVVHDEINAIGRRWGQQIVEVMETIVPSEVPFRAELSVGRDYAEASGWGTRKVGDVKEEYRPIYGDQNFMESFAWRPVS